MSLTLTDFFVFGLGIELVGAWLIARGLLAPLWVVKSFGTWGGIGAASVVDRARNRVDALFGVIYLGVGFLAQLIGYLAEIHGDRVTHGGGRLGDSLILLAVAMGAALGVWALLHRRALRAMLVQIAFTPLRADGAEEPESREKSLEWLGEYARIVEGGAELDEGTERYLRQMYGEMEGLGARRYWWWPLGRAELSD
jgi:hypothetical protein